MKVSNFFNGRLRHRGDYLPRRPRWVTPPCLGWNRPHKGGHMGGLEKFLFHPIVLGAFGTAMAVGLLIIGITLFLFKFLRKRIAADILGMPPAGSPESETWPYRNVLGPGSVQCPFPCSEHKAMLEKVEGMDDDLDEAKSRQKSLREDVLPEKFVSRRDHESCKKDRQSHESELFSRVGALERKQGVGC